MTPVTLQVQVMKIVEELDISTGTTERFLLVNFLGQEARFKANDGVIEAVMARSVVGVPQPAAPPEPGRPSELEDWAAAPPAPPAGAGAGAEEFARGFRRAPSAPAPPQDHSGRCARQPHRPP